MPFAYFVHTNIYIYRSFITYQNIRLRFCQDDDIRSSKQNHKHKQQRIAMNSVGYCCQKRKWHQNYQHSNENGIQFDNIQNKIFYLIGFSNVWLIQQNVVNLYVSGCVCVCVASWMDFIETIFPVIFDSIKNIKLKLYNVNERKCAL